MPSIDWNELERQAEVEDTPLPLQTPLTCVSESAQWQPAKGKGGPRLNVRLRVTQGPHKGKTVWHNVWISQGDFGASKTLRELSMYGLTKQVLQSTSEEEQCKIAVGKHVVVTLKQKDEYINVDTINRVEKTSDIPPRREDA